MQKIILKCLALVVMLMASSSVSAQISLGNILKSVTGKSSTTASATTKTTTTDSVSKTSTTSSALGSILGAVTGGSSSGSVLSGLSSIFKSSAVATKDQIIGTWTYEEPAVVFSSDNALASLGGKMASSTIESKLQEQLTKFGITKGKMKMTFDKDGNFTQTFGDKTVKGTYTVDDTNVNLKYGGSVSQIVGTTQIVDGDLLIVMDASKLLDFAKTLGSLTNNSTLQAASSLLGNLDGMQCGLRLKK